MDGLLGKEFVWALCNKNELKNGKKWRKILFKEARCQSFGH